LGQILSAFGANLRSTRDWLVEGGKPKTIADIENLHGAATERLRAIQAVINSHEKI
jgi:hypothetical protein